MAKILMINGSLHAGGFNEQLVNQIVALIGNRAEVSILDWGNVPMYVQNQEFPAPEIVTSVRKSVQSADAIWFLTPEYNYQIPGGLKNLTDWLSRSLDETNSRAESAIHGKITTVSAASSDGGSHVRPTFGRFTGIYPQPKSFVKMQQVLPLNPITGQAEN